MREEAESKEVQRDLASLFRYPCFFFIRVKKQARQSLGVENHKPRNAAHLDLCLRVTLCTSLILKVCQGILAKYEAANASSALIYSARLAAVAVVRYFRVQRSNDNETVCK